MSLGVKSLWRAQSHLRLVQGLSLGPREFRNQQPARSTLQARCWLSSSAEFPSPIGDPEPLSIQKLEIGQETTDVAPRDERQKGPLRRAFARKPAALSPSAQRRASLRRKMKAHVPSSYVTPMIKPSIQYPSKRASRRSLRKHVASARKQALHELARDALNKAPNDWRSTLDFMIRHTPKFGEVLDFKVGIGKGNAAQARATLSGLDTNLWQIQQRHHCKIRVESGFREDEPLILSLSGTTLSVRQALLELVGTVGRVSAVRVLDPALQISPTELWRGSPQGQSRIQLLRDGESAAEEEMVTVYGNSTDFAKMAERPKHKLYQLTCRADEIPRPTVWTRSSFERYVAKLVFARVPTHLHQSLYPIGLSHQATVVHLLTRLFSSEDLRDFMSVTALKMALQYIHARAPVFRPAARAISYQAELQHLPLDAEVFQTFLTSAARAGDIQGFNSVLRAMHRKGHYMRVETWNSFLTMIQNPKVKSYITRKMRSRGLHRLRPILEEIGRQKVILFLQNFSDTEIDMQRLLHAQESKYGSSWLDTITLNRIIDVLGSRGSLEACHELLDSVDDSRLVKPDHYTLNTMMTHTMSIPQKIALLSRWPKLRPDDVTYQLFFKAAWKQRLPNMLRIIWRYAVFANLTNSKMRYTLKELMRPRSVLSKNRALIKEWEDVILGRSELEAGRLLSSEGGKGFGTTYLMNKYKKDAGELRPLVDLAAKLQEAYEMDMKIHKLIKEGVEMSPSMKESLTVGIPLGQTQTGKQGASNEAPVELADSDTHPSIRRISV
ncbi:hypothetical protein F5Y07DRAFT_374750 [Xylaria sp. FL0933]|nr:hypothetical protein F5Y07DRAFT_374750 [Xylaria sp. FL0933]